MFPYPGRWLPRRLNRGNACPRVWNVWRLEGDSHLVGEHLGLEILQALVPIIDGLVHRASAQANVRLSPASGVPQEDLGEIAARQPSNLYRRSRGRRGFVAFEPC